MGNGNRTRTAFRLGDLFLLRTPGFAQMLALGYLWETETNGCRAVGVAEERKKKKRQLKLHVQDSKTGTDSGPFSQSSDLASPHRRKDTGPRHDGTRL